MAYQNNCRHENQHTEGGWVRWCSDCGRKNPETPAHNEQMRVEDHAEVTVVNKALLESAARVAGITGEYHEEWDAIVRSDKKDNYGRGVLWRPHADDAESFQLAIMLRIELGQAVAEQCDHSDVHELWHQDPIAATRRAVLRAAASKDHSTNID